LAAGLNDAIAAFLVFCTGLAVGLWCQWHALSQIGSAAYSRRGDVALLVWSLAAEARQLEHLGNPFYSSMLWAPSGVNLLDNTTEPLLGVLMAPVTITAGPVAAANLLPILALPLDALGAYAVARALGLTRLSSIAAGVVFGSNPFLLGSVFLGQAGEYFLFFAVVAIAGWAWFFRGAGAHALILALAAAFLELFVSPEVFAILVLSLASMAAFWMIDSPVARREVFGRLPFCMAALAVFCVAVALPSLYALAGPSHIEGPPWPRTSMYGVGLDWIVRLGPGTGKAQPIFELGGYLGRAPAPSDYLGLPLLGLALVGVAWLGMSSSRRPFAIWTAWTYLLAIGGSPPKVPRWATYVLPWHYLGHLPVISSILPLRFVSAWWVGASVSLGAGLEAIASVVGRMAPASRIIGLASSLAVLLSGLAVVVSHEYLPAKVQRLNQANPFIALASRDASHRGDPPVVACLPLPGAGAGEDCMVEDARAGLPYALIAGYIFHPDSHGKPIRLGRAKGVLGQMVLMSVIPDLAALEKPSVAEWRAYLGAHRVRYVVIRSDLVTTWSKGFLERVCRAPASPLARGWLMLRCDRRT
jgi:hypothetical protein